MSNGRLGGRGKKLGFEVCDRTYIWKHDSMEHALERFKRGWFDNAKAFGKSEQSISSGEGRTVLNGDNKLTLLMERADRLIDEVIAIDQRLARKSQWLMSADGDQAIDACPAAMMAGEERCYIARQKAKVQDNTGNGEPTVVVISTDSKHVSDDHAVAFIAAAKLAQQFKPLEIWWQGGWLYSRDDTNPKKRAAAGNGHILLTPLVKGTLDFSRLQYVLSNPCRDSVSYRIMFSYAAEHKVGYSSGVGERSYLNGYSDKFITEAGIRCDAQQVACYAADWAGLPTLWESQRDQAGDGASQYWEPPRSSEPERKKTREEIKADREREKRWDAESKEWERKRKEQRRSETGARLANV